MKLRRRAAGDFLLRARPVRCSGMRGGTLGAAMRVGLAVAASLVMGACGWMRTPKPPPPAPPPLVKITAFRTRVPARGELPPVVGEMQTYRIRPKDTLLDVARDAGLGFQEVKDANREVDEWIPPPGLEVAVPTRWILPAAPQRGVVVNIPEMRMYMFPARTKPGEEIPVRTWAIAIGSDDTPSPVGPFHIVSKDKNPTWVVPDSIYRTMERPRRVVPPGPDNPMGEYRIRLSKGLYSIHGTDTPWAIGRETTHGCLRLYPEDIGELYDLVSPKTTGVMVYEPVKLGMDQGHVYVEVHDDVYRRVRSLEREAFRLVRAARVEKLVDPMRLREAVRRREGVPTDISRDAGTPPGRLVESNGGQGLVTAQ